MAHLALDSGGHSGGLGIYSSHGLATGLQGLDAIRTDPQQDHHSDHYGTGIFSRDYANRLDTQAVIGGPDDPKF